MFGCSSIWCQTWLAMRLQILISKWYSGWQQANMTPELVIQIKMSIIVCRLCLTWLLWLYYYYNLSRPQVACLSILSTPSRIDRQHIGARAPLYCESFTKMTCNDNKTNGLLFSIWRARSTTDDKQVSEVCDMQMMSCFHSGLPAVRTDCFAWHCPIPIYSICNALLFWFVFPFVADVWSVGVILYALLVVSGHLIGAPQCPIQHFFVLFSYSFLIRVPYLLMTITCDNCLKKSNEDHSIYHTLCLPNVRICYDEWSKSTQTNELRYVSIVLLLITVPGAVQ